MSLTLKPTRPLPPHQSEVLAIACSPDGTKIATASRDRTIHLINATNTGEMFTLAGHRGAVQGIAFSPDGRTLASAGFDATVRLWDVATGEQLWSYDEAGGTVYSVAFSQDGQTLAAAVNQWVHGIMLFINLADKMVIPQHNARGEQLYRLAYSPSDHNLLAAAMAPGLVRLWHQGKAIHTARAHGETVQAVAFTLDGQTLASASADHTIRLWAVVGDGPETHLEGPLATLKGHTKGVRDVTVDPISRDVISCSGDGTLRLWTMPVSEALIGEPLAVIPAGQDVINTVVVDPAGTQVITGTRAGTVQVWQIAR